MQPVEERAERGHQRGVALLTYEGGDARDVE